MPSKISGKLSLLSNWKKETIYILLSALLAFISLIFMRNMLSADFRIPFVYIWDALGGYRGARNIINGHGWFIYPQLGAPSTFAIYQSSANPWFGYVIVWLFSLVFREPVFLMNMLFLFAHSAISAVTTYSLRLLKISPLVSIAGGVVYAAIAFTVAGVPNYFPVQMTVIPLACVVILWAFKGELEVKSLDENGKNSRWFRHLLCKKNVVAFITAILVGSVFINITVSILMITSFAIFWNIITYRSFKKVILPIVFVVIILAVVLLGLIPHFMFLSEGGDSGISATRVSQAVQQNAMRFIELLLPHRLHRILIMGSITDYYLENISISGRSTPPIGVIAGVGFLASFFIAIKVSKENVLKSSAILNVFIFILATIGGISSIVGLFFATFRQYGFMAIFIAFYSLVVVMYFIDKIVKVRFKPLLIILIAVVALFDISIPSRDVPKEERNLGRLNFHNHNREIFEYDRDFISYVEEITPPQSMVFQLPFIHSSVHGMFNYIPAYDHLKAFIHSSTLHWTFRPLPNSTAENWQERVSQLPTEQFLINIAANGFRGVYIDTRGYRGDDAQVLIEEIEAIVGAAPIDKFHPYMVYFYIGDYTDEIISNLSEIERKIYNWEIFESIELQPIFVGFELNSENQFLETLGEGWSNIEPWGIWNEGGFAEIRFSLLTSIEQESYDLFVNLNLNAFPDPTIFSVSINGEYFESYELPRGGGLISIPIGGVHADELGIRNVSLQFNIANPQRPPGDGRDLGIGLFSFSVSGE